MKFATFPTISPPKAQKQLHIHVKHLPFSLLLTNNKYHHAHHLHILKIAHRLHISTRNPLQFLSQINIKVRLVYHPLQLLHPKTEVHQAHCLPQPLPKTRGHLPLGPRLLSRLSLLSIKPHLPELNVKHRPHQLRLRTLEIHLSRLVLLNNEVYLHQPWHRT
ncbi:hypothetical protein BGZ60DRAFT_395064 [Tricladium varicosporioides]|nr:hypothetical protein BGZ60DRAFT_395064 [Hymenoscyphus varicosporioides]